ncbi:MAG TPA: histidine kinase [Flavisolibacter sp.]|nr:histidine kinase [Flavisolibacter sp.]
MNIFSNYRIRIIGALVITALRFGFQMSDTLAGLQLLTWGSVLNNFVWALLTGVITWETNRLVVLYFNRRNPLGKLSARRLGKEAIVVFVVNGLVYGTSVAIFFILSAEAAPPKLYLILGLFDRFLHGMLVAAFYELLVFMEALRRATQEAEQLKKVNVMMQLESLKNQVKPHFLFNSLNTLTGLVEKDTPRAVKFIAELSKVYRYLLQSNEKELIQLSQELTFTEAYFFLLQTRFGEGIHLAVEVEEKYLTHFIPPLTLQMLLENAVKHNQVSARKPLLVTIKAEGEELVVANNFQPKRSVATSNGMGLTNIAAKYKLLNQPDVVILSEEEQFTVRVPLIKPIDV